MLQKNGVKSDSSSSIENTEKGGNHQTTLAIQVSVFSSSVGSE